MSVVPQAVSHAGHAEFLTASRFVGSRVRAEGDVSRHCICVPEIHVQTSETGLYRRMRTTKNVTRSLFACQLLLRTEQHPACLWFGVGLSTLARRRLAGIC